jgi:hypothetical protein
MTPRQRALFLAATRLRSQNHSPVLADLAAGRLSLTSRARASVQRRGEKPPRYRLEPPEKREAAPVSGAAEPETMIRHPVTEIHLELRWSAQMELSFFFAVAPLN